MVAAEGIRSPTTGESMTSFHTLSLPSDCFTSDGMLFGDDLSGIWPAYCEMRSFKSMMMINPNLLELSSLFQLEFEWQVSSRVLSPETAELAG